ncbi:Zn-dependent protease (includes SpoIVFB) [Cognatiyoonia koreensis]|uniref:Zinc metalloprotease n=1 Tax=Cognatiyoonia koreensis TaxID=364200 RepID=A0A1I0QHF9_9RHOB|nr:site-2 protease family protein [Cognatiyoonia koreensis]SEW26587.1 Zn-dependent protease (includes SpoIVFB) [Cognatiyoonia koreensis]
MFSKSVTLFSMQGIDIKIDPSWLLIAALITWSLSQQYFPISLPDQSPAAYFLMALVAMLCFFASLLLHELAHSAVAIRYGVPINGITLFLFGGMAELEKEPPTAFVEFVIALAGPLMSFALAFAFWVVAEASVVAGSAASATAVLSYLAMINFVLAVFNLVPAFPLDGGRILRAALWYRSGDSLKATETAAGAGKIFAYVLIGLGVLALFQGAFVVGLWQILIGTFLYGAAQTSYQSELMRTAFKEKTVGALMKRDPQTATVDMTISDFVNQIMLAKRVTFAPVVAENVLLGHIDQAVLADIDRENWNNTRVEDVYAALTPDATVPQDMPIADLLTHIAKTGRRKFLVLEGGDLAGVITLADISSYLQVVEPLLRGGLAAKLIHAR